MNDRTSAKPPPAFLGPDLAAYERQFYGPGCASPGGGGGGKHRRLERPLSAEAHLMTTGDHATNQAGRFPITKKATFFGRLRGALGLSWVSNSNNTTTPNQNKDDAKRKHTSLQDTCMPPPAATSQPQAQQQHASRPPARTWKSQSQIHIQHMPSIGNLQPNTNLTDRPSRDEILESYHHLMASGFFQAHAIQSTRQPGPRVAAPRQHDNSFPISGPALVPAQPSRRPPPLPTIPSNGSDMYAENDAAKAMSAALAVAQENVRASQELRRGDSMDWQATPESRYTLRGRKRGRTDTDEGGTVELSLAQPLRKMARRLRKIPSSLTSANTAAPAQLDTVDRLPVQRVPSVSMGGLPIPSDRQLRPRGPSPAPPVEKSRTPRRSIPVSDGIDAGSAKPRKPSMTPSPVKSRLPPVSRGGPEAVTIRSSTESPRREFVESPFGAGSLKVSRVRERNRPNSPNPLGARPHSYQNVPQVPRIPSIYKQQNRDISSSENTRPWAVEQQRHS